MLEEQVEASSVIHFIFTFPLNFSSLDPELFPPVIRATLI